MSGSNQTNITQLRWQPRGHCWETGRSTYGSLDVIVSEDWTLIKWRKVIIARC